MAVLVLSRPDDEHATAVADEIARNGGRAEIVDLSLFPQKASLAMRYDCCGQRRFRLELEDRVLDLDDFGTVWWRRPQQPLISPGIRRDSDRLFAANESQEALAGLWHSLDAFWVNDPGRDFVAQRKAYQLKVAHDVGLTIPSTLITNDPDEARLFADSRGYRGVVYKSFAATEEAWRETRVLRAEELDLLDNVRYAPVIFQEYVDALYDLRITVVGKRLFPAAIYSQETEYPIDFRMDIANARIEPVAVSRRLEFLVQELMGRLGLQYGAIDMRYTPEGNYVFLEINPAGQWLFVEQPSEQPIAAAVADLLLDNDRVGTERVARTAAGHSARRDGD
jgi:glutathione synthase/RimK-type ligase-like ATP-grasp enzyme